MIRLLGAITGSALALATLLVLIGVPQFKVRSDDVEREIMTLPLPTSPVDTTGPAPAAATTSTASIDSGVPAETNTAPAEPAVAADPPVQPDGDLAAIVDEGFVDPLNAGTGIDDDAVPVRRDGSAPYQAAAPAAAGLAAASDPRWYAFWSPFRSEIAAAGFVARLQSVTGLDYRVVKVKTGVYEVAFAYEDDTDIPTNLSQITAATGLDLPEG